MSVIAIARYPKKSANIGIILKELYMPPLQIFLVVLSISITLFALLISIDNASQQHDQGFTQLWILPTENDQIRVGVYNSELQTTEYSLKVLLVGQVIDEQSLTLGYEETWETIITLPELPTGNFTMVPIEAKLFLGDSTDVYRRVLLWK